ncbi:hypothetical protein P3395_26335, partial [Vibrio parahaemolyticus]|nr:hypothetical protein [Vibrio parahaemolyticus]
ICVSITHPLLCLICKENIFPCIPLVNKESKDGQQQNYTNFTQVVQYNLGLIYPLVFSVVPKNMHFFLQNLSIQTLT